ATFGSTTIPISPASGTGTITNDDTLTMTISSPSILEGNTLTKTLTFVATFPSAAPADGSLTYSTADGTATVANNDYVPLTNASVAFAAGATSVNLTVTINGDTVAEQDETFTVTLTGATFGSTTIPISPASGTGTGTITNDDSIKMTINDVAIAEGNTGNTAFTFTVSLDYPADGNVTVAYATSDLTAIAGKDYIATSGTLSLLPLLPPIPAVGQTGTVTVNVIGNTIYEPAKIFALLLSNVTTTGTIPVVIADNQGLGTIQNDDAAIPVVGFSAVTYSVGEGDGNAVLRVRLSAPAPGPISVPYTLTDGSATRVPYPTSNATGMTTDYTGTGGIVTFIAGQIEQTISVPITNDTDPELDEIFSATLMVPTGATLDPTRTAATIAIIDDDTLVPPVSQASFLQTAGQTYNANGWNFYANTGTYTYLRIDVPCVNNGKIVQIDLYDAGLNHTIPIPTLPALPNDQINGAPDGTIFELYKMPAGWNYVNVGSLPAAGTAAPTYTVDTTKDAWNTFATIAPSVAPATPSCGIYLLRAETQGDNMNGWGIRVGWQVASTIPPTPPTSDGDGIAGSGDEITVGIQQTTLSHDNIQGVQCTTFYEYVSPGQPSIKFNNYDLDSSSSTGMPGLMPAWVSYYPPSASYDPHALVGGVAGSPSGDNTWNGLLGNSTTRDGDTITNPESGWWRIVTCTGAPLSTLIPPAIPIQNQFIQEGQTDKASYTSQPGTPALSLSVTNAATVVKGTPIAFTANYTNTSSGITAGAAISTTFTVTLPSDLTFVTGSCTGATSCTLSGNTLTIKVGTVGATKSGVVTFSTTASTNAGMVGLSLVANYNDVMGNPFVGSAATTTTITP
ncbi:MAG: Calx-beta domain-containing protein, partial [Chloroflexales bacterium]